MDKFTEYIGQHYTVYRMAYTGRSHNEPTTMIVRGVTAGAQTQYRLLYTKGGRLVVWRLYPHLYGLAVVAMMGAMYYRAYWKAHEDTYHSNKYHDHIQDYPAARREAEAVVAKYDQLFTRVAGELAKPEPDMGHIRRKLEKGVH